jgi:hypothetical protein
VQRDEHAIEFLRDQRREVPLLRIEGVRVYAPRAQRIQHHGAASERHFAFGRAAAE